MQLIILQPCKLPQDNRDNSKLLCRMPAVSLPDVLHQQLLDSESGTISDERGFGVAGYQSSDGRVHADIFVGILLDGLRLYHNINSVDPTLRMQFAVRPNITCPPEVLTFKSDTDDTIAIQVTLFLWSS